MIEEQWKDIVGYEGLYQISNFGRVKSICRLVNTKSKGKETKRHIYEKILKNCINGCGYEYVCLSKKGKTKKHRIHRLVGEYFIPNPFNKPQLNHIDGNKLNNNINNLEWCNNSENMQHAVKMGLWRNPKLIGKKVKN